MAMLFRGRSGGQDDGDEAMSDINIVPLVDVMLVLLIIFMITAPLSISGIRVDLPRSVAKGTTVDEDRIVLSINAKGDYYIDKMSIPAGVLPIRIKAIYEHRQKKELYIRADRSVEYGRVVDAMSAAKQAGVSKIAMLTQPPVQAKGKTTQPPAKPSRTRAL